MTYRTCALLSIFFLAIVGGCGGGSADSPDTTTGASVSVPCTQETASAQWDSQGNLIVTCGSATPAVVPRQMLIDPLVRQAIPAAVQAAQQKQR